MSKFRAALASLVLATGLVGGATALASAGDEAPASARSGHWCC